MGSVDTGHLRVVGREIDGPVCGGNRGGPVVSEDEEFEKKVDVK